MAVISSVPIPLIVLLSCSVKHFIRAELLLQNVSFTFFLHVDTLRFLRWKVSVTLGIRPSEPNKASCLRTKIES